MRMIGIKPAAGSPASRKPRLLLLAKLSATVAIFALLLSNVDLSRCGDAVAGARPEGLVLAFASCSLALITSVAKWDRLLRGLGVTVAKGLLLQIYLIGFFFCSFLPGVVAGDLVRCQLTGKTAGGRIRAAASILIERFTGVIAMVALSVAIVACDFTRLATPPVIVVIAGSLVALVLGVIVVINRRIATGLMYAWRRHRLRRVMRVLHRLRQTLQACPRPAFRMALVWSLLFYLGNGVELYLFAAALGVPITLFGATATVVVVCLLTLVPISVGGLGLRQAGDVYMLGVFGVDPATALAISLARQLANYGYALLGGAAFVGWRGVPATSHGADGKRGMISGWRRNLVLMVAATIGTAGVYLAGPIRVVLGGPGTPETTELTASSGEKVNVLVRQPPDMRPALSPAVIFIHGHADNGAANLGYLLLCEMLANKGYVVVTPWLRGYDHPEAAKPKQPFAEERWDPRPDIVATFEHLRRNPRVDPSRIYVVGHSLGGGYALLFGLDEPEVAGVVSLSRLDMAQRLSTQRERLRMRFSRSFGLASPIPQGAFDEFAQSQLLAFERAEATLIRADHPRLLFAIGGDESEADRRWLSGYVENVSGSAQYHEFIGLNHWLGVHHRYGLGWYNRHVLQDVVSILDRWMRRLPLKQDHSLRNTSKSGPGDSREIAAHRLRRQSL